MTKKHYKLINQHSLGQYHQKLPYHLDPTWFLSARLDPIGRLRRNHAAPPASCQLSARLAAYMEMDI